jgi:hypothetical protein
MAIMLRYQSVICGSILLICAGCGTQGPTTPPSPIASPLSKTAAIEEANSSSTAAPLPEPSQASTVPPSDAPSAPIGSETQGTITANSEIFHDSFADVAGSVRWNRDGVKSAEGPPSQRMIYFFNGMPEGGPLVMRVVEDSALSGPDGMPGVLALSWVELPAKLPYSGFTFLGGRNAAEQLTLAPLKQAKSADDLRQFQLTFRHKGMNERSSMPLSLNVGCRVEPLLADSYAKRLDLGTLTATGQWGTFEMAFAQGTNSEAFLRAIADENPRGFKIVWSQVSSLASYRPGDTLLIDDIVVTNSAAK